MSPGGELPAVHFKQIASDQSSRRESRKQMSQSCNRSNQMGSQADAASAVYKKDEWVPIRFNNIINFRISLTHYGSFRNVVRYVSTSPRIL